MRILVGLSILLGIACLLSALMPSRPEAPSLVTVSPLRIATGLV